MFGNEFKVLKYVKNTRATLKNEAHSSIYYQLTSYLPRSSKVRPDAYPYEGSNDAPARYQMGLLVVHLAFWGALEWSF